jgi:hypothetical protein
LIRHIAARDSQGAALVLPSCDIEAMRCPELNLVENLWQFLRDTWLSDLIFQCYDSIVNHAAKPGKGSSNFQPTSRPLACETVISSGTCISVSQVARRSAGRDDNKR